MLISVAILLCLAVATQPEPQIQRHGTSFSDSVVLVDNAALAHTAQLIADQRDHGSLDQEISDVLEQLSALLQDLGSSKSDLVKLNLYALDDQTTDEAMKVLSTWCPVDARPAVTTVRTALPGGRKFAIDAVFVARQQTAAKIVSHRFGNDAAGRSHRQARLSVLPRGDAVYISGRAEPGDLATATRSTLQALAETLQFLDLSRSDVVRVKCFLQPISQVETVDREIAAFFAESGVPAVSHVQWIPGGSRPIEIEMVAAAPTAESTDTVSFLTPPGLKASPVFSRVARIHGNRRIYMSGLVSQQPGDGGSQVHSIFQQLIRRLRPVRSNLRHLAKATYYVADADASSQLNLIRPHYYDPERPPAASKAMILGTGIPDRTISVDIIAAPEAPVDRVLAPLAAELEPTRKVVYKTIGDHKLHLHVFEPAGHRASDRRPVFLAIHGGGWTAGRPRDFYPFAAHFADQGMLGISLEYRLKSDSLGTTVFDCVDDVRSAIRWIRANANRMGMDPQRIVAMGGSAGGHLAISTTLPVSHGGEDHDISARPDALIMMYPVIDTSAAGYGQAKIGDRWQQLSPLHNVRAGLPAALIFHGTADAVTPYVGAQQFQQRSTAAGNESILVTHPGGRHGYIIFDREEYQRALARMKQFLTEQQFLPAK